MLCRTCGLLLVQKKRGRPREFHDECKNANSLLLRLEAYAARLNFSSDEESQRSIRELRRRLWRIANRLNPKTKPRVSRTAAGKFCKPTKEGSPS